MPELALYQVLTPLLSIIMFLRALSFFRRRQRSLRELLIQILFWGSIAFIAFFPDFFINYVSRFTGIKSGITGILFLSILLLGMTVFYLLHENERRSQEITKLIRHLALQDFQQKKK